MDENQIPMIEPEGEEVKEERGCDRCRDYLEKISAQGEKNNRPLSPLGWVGVNLLMLIPPINLLFLFLWACGGTERTNLKNYCRGVLLTGVILLLLFLVTVVVLDFCGLQIALPEWANGLLR